MVLVFATAWAAEGLPAARGPSSLPVEATLATPTHRVEPGPGCADLAWAPLVVRLGADGVFLGDTRLAGLDALADPTPTPGSPGDDVRDALHDLAGTTDTERRRGCVPPGRPHLVALVAAPGDLPSGPVEVLVHWWDLAASVPEVAFLVTPTAPTVPPRAAPWADGTPAVVDLRADGIHLLERQTQVSGRRPEADPRAAVPAALRARPTSWLFVQAEPGVPFRDWVAAIDAAHEAGAPCVAALPSADLLPGFLPVVSSWLATGSPAPAVPKDGPFPVVTAAVRSARPQLTTGACGGVSRLPTTK